MTLSERLATGLTELGLSVPALANAKLMDYLELLRKWNRVHNLTAIREPEQMVSQHLLDSLAIVPTLAHYTTLVDVGSGGGLPGIPIAIVCPHLTVTLLDSNHKKTAFLRQAKTELMLKNVEVVCERVEAWQPSTKFDAVISRAFSDLSEFAQLAAHLVREDGALLAMKGVYPYEELARLPEAFRLNKVVSLQIPNLDAERHLIVVNKAAA